MVVSSILLHASVFPRRGWSSTSDLVSTKIWYGRQRYTIPYLRGVLHGQRLLSGTFPAGSSGLIGLRTAEGVSSRCRPHHSVVPISAGTRPGVALK